MNKTDARLLKLIEALERRDRSIDGQHGFRSFREELTALRNDLLGDSERTDHGDSEDHE